MENHEFESKLHSFMHQALRAAANPSAVGLEKIRGATDSMARLLRDLTKYEAGEVGNCVQETLENSFIKIGADIERLEGRVDELFEEVAKLWIKDDSVEEKDDEE
jgi:pyruvate-formate lyase